MQRLKIQYSLTFNSRMLPNKTIFDLNDLFWVFSKNVQITWKISTTIANMILELGTGWFKHPNFFINLIPINVQMGHKQFHQTKSRFIYPMAISDLCKYVQVFINFQRLTEYITRFICQNCEHLLLIKTIYPFITCESFNMHAAHTWACMIVNLNRMPNEIDTEKLGHVHALLLKTTYSNDPIQRIQDTGN